MERCGSCGARLGPGADWCGQCFTPVLRQPAAPSDRPEQPSGQPAEPGPPGVAVAPKAPGPAAAGPPAAGWAPSAPGAPPATRKGPDPFTEPVYEQPEFSRWKGGPESFGPVGRIVLTLLLLGAVAAGLPLFQGALFAFARALVPQRVLLWLYLAIAVPFTIWALLRIWKKTRVK